MFRNYLLVAVRNLMRNRTVSAINIAGLSIGLACCMLILLYIKDDLSYDRFHRNRNDIYCFTMQVLNPDGSLRAMTASTGAVFGPAFKKLVPGIRDYTRLSTAHYALRKDDRVLEQYELFADSNFLAVFSFPLLRGNPHTALSGLHDLVITEQTAKKYFGTIDVLGKTLEFQIDKRFVPFRITGVARDCPQNSTINFHILLPMKFREAAAGAEDWMTFDVSTFLLLSPNEDPASVLTKMTRVYTA